MIIKNAEFTVSATSPKQYPKDDLPQIVLVGKSNVGKSSFINTMLNRKKLARTSSEPGKTRLINFYKAEIKNSEICDTDNINPINEFYFVDLPGYGFSKMSKQEQMQVGNFIEEYLLDDKILKEEMEAIREKLKNKERDDFMRVHEVIRRDREKYKKEGKLEQAIIVAQKMLEENIDVNLIMKITGLKKEQFMK